MIIAKRLFNFATIAALAVTAAAVIWLHISDKSAFSVQSASMEPAISKGDIVAVTNVPSANLKTGDIITFTPSGQTTPVTHRLIGTDQDGMLITKGDANMLPDEPVDPTRVIGKVTYQLPLVGYAVDFIKQPIGLMLAVYLPAIAITVVEVKRLQNYFRSRVHFILPSSEPHYVHKRGWWRIPLAHSVLILALLASTYVPVWGAALFDSTGLTGITISSVNDESNERKQTEDKSEDDEKNEERREERELTNEQCDISSDTDINVSDSTSQTMRSGADESLDDDSTGMETSVQDEGMNSIRSETNIDVDIENTDCPE